MKSSGSSFMATSEFELTDKTMERLVEKYISDNLKIEISGFTNYYENVCEVTGILFLGKKVISTSTCTFTIVNNPDY